jgi:excisionase family DNA binding protein
MDPVLTIDEVAAAVRCHRRTIQRLIAAGKLEAFQIGSDYRIKESALNAYIESTSNIPAAKAKKKAVKKTAKKKPKKKGGR